LAKITSNPRAVEVTLDPNEFIGAEVETPTGMVFGGWLVRYMVQTKIITKYPQIQGAKSITTTYQDGQFKVTYELEE
jgi:hypothetical protein